MCPSAHSVLHHHLSYPLLMISFLGIWALHIHILLYTNMCTIYIKYYRLGSAHVREHAFFLSFWVWITLLDTTLSRQIHCNSHDFTFLCSWLQSPCEMDHVFITHLYFDGHLNGLHSLAFVLSRCVQVSLWQNRRPWISKNNIAGLYGSSVLQRPPYWAPC